MTARSPPSSPPPRRPGAGRRGTPRYAAPDRRSGFPEWLESMSANAGTGCIEGRIRGVRGGKLNDSEFGSRMCGTGEMAKQIADLSSVSSPRSMVWTAGCRPTIACAFDRRETNRDSSGCFESDFCTSRERERAMKSKRSLALAAGRATPHLLPIFLLLGSADQILVRRRYGRFANVAFGDGGHRPEADQEDNRA